VCVWREERSWFVVRSRCSSLAGAAPAAAAGQGTKLFQPSPAQPTPAARSTHVESLSPTAAAAAQTRPAARGYPAGWRRGCACTQTGHPLCSRRRRARLGRAGSGAGQGRLRGRLTRLGGFLPADWAEQIADCGALSSRAGGWARKRGGRTAAAGGRRAAGGQRAGTHRRET
jgi:hypothetical protein